MAYAYEIPITLAGNRRIDAEVHGHLIRTDQPRWKGGKDKDPSPFDLFLASIGTCAGLSVQNFCAANDISVEGIKVIERVSFDDEGDLCEVDVEIQLPATFPEKYAEAVCTIVEQCQVERVIRTQPTFIVTRARVAAVR